MPPGVMLIYEGNPAVEIVNLEGLHSVPPGTRVTFWPWLLPMIMTGSLILLGVCIDAHGPCCQQRPNKCLGFELQPIGILAFEGHVATTDILI